MPAPIIWLNGPFGVGKTTVADYLQAHLPESFLFDPEEIGFVIRKLTPPDGQKDDFQDFPLWRNMVTKTLQHSANHLQAPLIVPMTLVKPAYFAEIIQSLREEGLSVHHVILLAAKATILNRLKNRGNDETTWPAKQLERCLEGLHQLDARDFLWTDTLSVKEIAKEISERFALELSPDL